MHLTQYTDYSLRTLIYLGQKPDGVATITEVAEFYGISRNHLVKVVHHLSQAGYLITTRGKNGGIRLARAPEQVTLGEVVRRSEPGFTMAECFDPEKNTCVLSPSCFLKGVLGEATQSFLDALDRHTLAECVVRPAAPAGTHPTPLAGVVVLHPQTDSD